MNKPSTPVTFAVLALLLVLSGLDQTVLSTALPTIVGQLGGRDLATWVFSAYLLATTAVIPLYGNLADRLGLRPVLLTSVALFAAGSLACALARSMPALVAARALQGLGGGGLMTLTMLSVASMYPLAERGRRMGTLGAAYGLSTLAGPLVGASLLQVLPWTWAFWLNVPLGLTAGCVLHRAQLGQAHARAPAFDWAGAGLLAAALTALLLATRADGAVPLPLTLTAAAMLGAAWLWVERHAADPVVPLQLFAVRPFRTAGALAVLSGAMLYAAVVFVPLFLQQGLGLSPVRAALVALPLMLGITAGGQLAGRWLRAGMHPAWLAARAAWSLMSGFIGLAVILHGWAVTGTPFSLGWVAVTLLPPGLGLGLLFPLITITAQRSAALRHQGAATAMPVMLRALGGAAGVAVLGELLRRHMAAAVTQGLHSHQDAMRAMADGTARIAVASAVLAIVVWVASRPGVAWQR